MVISWVYGKVCGRQLVMDKKAQAGRVLNHLTSTHMANSSVWARTDGSQHVQAVPSCYHKLSALHQGTAWMQLIDEAAQSLSQTVRRKSETRLQSRAGLTVLG